MEGLLHFFLAKIIFLALTSSFVSCSDPNPLQDFCVAADETNGVYVNGKFCKDPKSVTDDDFYTSGLNIPGNTMNRFGFNNTPVDVDRIRGHNTLGVSMARVDMLPGGQNTPHFHPRASEIFLVLQGKILAGSVTSSQNNYRLFSKILYPGDAWVNPMGMIHYQVNVGLTNAVAYVAFGSQHPGLTRVMEVTLRSNPSIPQDVLAKAFGINASLVKTIQEEFSFNVTR